jgi:glycosyltransferase involved in cell wall biosynthesis
MKLSVIIPCYNGAATIGVQIESLIAQECPWPWELIVADNGSTDESTAVVETYRPHLPALTIVDAGDKKGAAYALNQGAKAASGDALLFCDADDEVGESWLAAMGAALTTHDFVACRFDMKRLNPGWSVLNNPQAEGIQTIWYPPYLPHAGSGGMGISRHWHEAIGGFDESLMILYDTDYCFRLQMRGVALHFVPDAVLHVRSRSTLPAIYRQAKGYAEYNVLLANRYRGCGKGEERPWQRYGREWLHLLKLLPRIYQPRVQARVAWRLGQQMGRLRGAVKYGAPPV